MVYYFFVVGNGLSMFGFSWPFRVKTPQVLFKENLRFLDPNNTLKKGERGEKTDPLTKNFLGRVLYMKNLPET